MQLETEPLPVNAGKKDPSFYAFLLIYNNLSNAELPKDAAINRLIKKRHPG